MAARQRDRLVATRSDRYGAGGGSGALEVFRAGVRFREGRWTIKAAIDEGVPAPVLSTALYERFFSRGDADYQNKLLSAMRYQFGGHLEKPASK